MTYGADRSIVNAVIPIGTALSGEVNVNAKRIVGIIMPAGWDAAGIAFRALIAEPPALPKVPVYGNVVDQAGAAVGVTAAAGAYIALPDSLALIGLGRIIVVSGTNAVPVNQTAARTIGLVCVDV
jgi:hypothetical protein